MRPASSVVLGYDSTSPGILLQCCKGTLCCIFKDPELGNSVTMKVNQLSNGRVIYLRRTESLVALL